MVKKIGDDQDKKIGKISQTQSSEEVKKAQEVSEVKKTQATSGIARVGATASTGKTSAAHSITLAKRAELFSMIEEEADRLFGKEKGDRRKIIEDAVKMAIDAAIAEDSETKKQ